MDLNFESFDNSGEVETIEGEASIEACGDNKEPKEYRSGEFAGKIDKVSGDVWVVRPDGSRKQATDKTILLKDDYVQTGAGSKFEFRNDKGDHIRVGSRTVIHTGSGRHNLDATAVLADEG